MACRIIVSAPVSVPFLWTLDLGLGFWTWILDLDLGLDLGLTTVYRHLIIEEVLEGHRR